MSHIIAIPIGSVFGHLTVIDGPLPKNKSAYVCRCECGRKKTVRGVALRHGQMKSCGCSFKTARPTTSKYGQAGEWNKPEYKIWLGLKARCLNPKNCNWARYGGKGIRLCERWALSYRNFLADMGRKPTPKHSIDRLDYNGHYSPDNCRWATRIEQQNNRTDNRWIQFNGQTHTIAGWARTFNIPYTRFSNHLRRHDFDIGLTMAAIAHCDSR